MADHHDDADSASSAASSSDSDDDFLTLKNEGEGGGSGAVVNREALIRKKLLENFYGKSAVAAAAPAGSEGEEEDEEEEDSDIDSSPRINTQGRSDLDSANFDAEAHTRRHVLGSSVQTLLETEEKLALQVRTLDSTMQTLVYENYSRFIDATDAIRSIGVNVQANEDGLNRLTKGINSVDEQSRSVEEALGSLRDQVAEKIRIKRLLTRLDSLLKLPRTLKEQIAAGKYLTATKSYLSASSILSKHSEGFESLKTIETECNTILQDMKKDLKRKLLHWSGRMTTFGEETDYGADHSVAHPPKSMKEIFECAGTLFMLLESENEGTTNSIVLEDEHGAAVDDLQSLSISASVRFLDRLLDAHMIEVQERHFGAPGLDTSLGRIGIDHQLGNTSLSSLSNLPPEPKGSKLVPTEVLDGILEAATLFGSSFGGIAESGDLDEFVSEAFSSFLMHVRSILLEESARVNQDDDNTGEPVTTDEGREDADKAQEEEISGAVSILVRSVRELASGLALPEVGISLDHASSLVEQVMDLTESMVRRRVDQKFLRLRQNVVRDCLVPFVTRAVAERADAISSGNAVLDTVVQLARSTLSDCLQLVDDTIRSIFSGGGLAVVPSESGLSGSPDMSILKDAVQASTHRFASWLASALEILAGGESSDPIHIIEATNAGDGFEEEMDERLEGSEIHPQKITVAEDLGDMACQESAVTDLVDEGYKALLNADRCSDNTVHSDFILAIAEMCRLAEGSVSENLNQSIAIHLGGGGGAKKKSRGIFPSSESSPSRKAQDEADAITKRFRMATSRLILLFATNRGSDAAKILCADLSNVAGQEELDSPAGPRSATCDALEVVKKTSIECAGIFGEKKRAGPVPTMEEDSLSALPSPLLARKSGLQLDVERMFKEKVTIYPNPSDPVEASRNSILFLVLKVLFRALAEQSRMSEFSPAGYRQLQMDTEFLKLMVPHYISSDFLLQGNNACTSLSSLLGDVLSNAGERCIDEGMEENDQVRHESRQAVRHFMLDIDSTDICQKFIIKEEE